MPRPKGLPKTGGRKKGSKNRTEADKYFFGPDFRSAMKELAIARLTPLEVMHAVMFIKIGKGDYDGAMLAAEKAAPFCHPKLNAAEVHVQHSLSAHTSEELAADILALREKLAIVQQRPVGTVIDLIPERAQGVGQSVGHDDT
jgi:hypothetical protein